MTKPKRHHYLPQSYLAGFTREHTTTGVFTVFDCETNEYRPQTPLNTAIKGYFYALVNETGDRDLRVEDALGVIEGLAIPIIKSLDRGNSISLEEKQLLALFVGLLHTRVPQFERAIREATDGIEKALHVRAFSNVDRVADALRQWEREHGKASLVTPQELHEYIHAGEYQVVPHRNTVVRSMLEIGRNIGWRLWQMTWMIAVAPAETSFITTDSPLVVFPPDGLNHNQPYGVGSRGAITVVPLSQRVCICMSGPGHLAVINRVPKSEVRQINIALAQHCERFIIGRDEQLVKSIVAKSRASYLAKRPIIRMF